MRTLRAVLASLFVLANLSQAIPYVKMSEEDLHDPEWSAADFDLWYEWFGPALPMDREVFGELCRRFFWASHETVRMIRAPTEPFFDATHTSQQWGLFAVVAQAPDRLVIEVRRQVEPGRREWQTLYRSLDREHDWHDPVLKYRRIRGVWDGVKDEPKGTYKRMTQWIARTVFREQPDVDRVRVVLEGQRIAWPWEPPETVPKRRAERYHKREDELPKEAR